MKNETNDGGPAFPNAKLIEVRCPETGNPQDTYVVPVGGMTLRDYFAAKALQVLISREDDWSKWQMVTRYLPDGKPVQTCDAMQSIAFVWHIADAMLAAREGKQ